MFLCRMEREVVSLMAVGDTEANKYIGRVEGPKFVFENDLENGNGGTRKTIAVSRAWRRTGGWLDDLRSAVHE